MTKRARLKNQRSHAGKAKKILKLSTTMMMATSTGKDPQAVAPVTNTTKKRKATLTTQTI